MIEQLNNSKYNGKPNNIVEEEEQDAEGYGSVLPHIQQLNIDVLQQRYMLSAIHRYLASI